MGTQSTISMFRFAIAAALFASASAFTPSAVSPSTQTAVTRSGPTAAHSADITMSVESELGVLPPVGYFDPLGFGKDENRFARRRAVEIKHGRVSMLATVGYIFPEVIGRFGGELSPSLGISFRDVPNGLGAITAVPIAGWAQIIGFVGLLELEGFKQYPEKAPGDVAGDFFDWKRYDDPAVKADKLTKELQNGRLAMLGIMGMMVQEALTGQNTIEQLASGHISPFGDGQGYF